MKKIIVGCVLLGAVAPSAADERPPEAATERVDLKDHPKAKPPADWIELATPTPAKHGTEFIPVAPNAGSLTTLRVDLAKGKVIVERVKVTFHDGTVKVIDRRTRLDDEHNQLVLDLGEGKPIDQIAVTTETYTNGSYAVYGSTATRGVATR